MRSLAFLAATAFLTVPLGGCMDLLGGGDGVSDEPRTWEFTLLVPASSDQTVALYEKNDGTDMRVVWIGFMTPDQEAPALPGPEIRVKEGDTVRLTVLNNNRLSHTLHLHGGLDDWEDDGVDYLTQFPIAAGEEHTYVYEDLKAGTYWYHCHVDAVHHIDLGMYGAFIVEEREPPVKFDREYVLLLDEVDNCHVHGNTDPATNQEQTGNIENSAECYYRFVLDNLAQNRAANTVGTAIPDPVKQQVCPVLETLPEDTPEEKRAKDAVKAVYGCDGDHAHGSPPVQQAPREWWFETAPLYAPVYNTFLVNGKAFPDTPVFPVEESETVRFRLINVGNQVHSWHPHGHTMTITHKDGYELPAFYQADTLLIGPGERYDFVMEMKNPGLWLMHDHANGVVNDQQHPGGMMTCLAYDGFGGVDAFALERSLDCNTEAVRILEERGHDHGG